MKKPGSWPGRGVSGGEARIRTGDKGFAGLCLTTWPLRRVKKADCETGRINHGAGYGVRTRDLNLGKVARYQLRQARVARNNIGDCHPECKHFFEKISSSAKTVSEWGVSGEWGMWL